jgi:hypothetical protein
MVYGLWLMVYGLWFRVQGSGFRVQGSGFWVYLRGDQQVPDLLVVDLQERRLMG